MHKKSINWGDIQNTTLIKANWSVEELIQTPKIDISTLTEEEQADLIVERLRTPPRETTLEGELASIMAMVIQKEIDAKILKNISTQTKYFKGK